MTATVATPRPLAKVATYKYEARWHRKPQGRSEVWALMDLRYRGLMWYYRGPWSHLIRALDPAGQWLLEPIPQIDFGVNNGFIRNI
jgi:hypothetical protein